MDAVARPPPAKPGTPATALAPWDGLRVGSHGVAKYWLLNGAADGWWIAKVTAINGKDFTVGMEPPSDASVD